LAHGQGVVGAGVGGVRRVVSALARDFPEFAKAKGS
jgi:hypothetical protein